jgi:hypothetical protein
MINAATANKESVDEFGFPCAGLSQEDLSQIQAAEEAALERPLTKKQPTECFDEFGFPTAALSQEELLQIEAAERAAIEKMARKKAATQEGCTQQTDPPPHTPQADPPPHTPHADPPPYTPQADPPPYLCLRNSNHGYCVVRTSTTPGNRNRQFYKCTSCNAFQWCDLAKESSYIRSLGQQPRTPTAVRSSGVMVTPAVVSDASSKSRAVGGDKGGSSSKTPPRSSSWSEVAQNCLSAFGTNPSATTSGIGTPTHSKKRSSTDDGGAADITPQQKKLRVQPGDRTASGVVRPKETWRQGLFASLAKKQPELTRRQLL